MKYEFDEIIDRVHDPYSFAAKWQEPDYVLRKLGVEARDDMICLETADMDFRTAPEIIADLKALSDHGIFGYSIIPDAYRQAVCDWYRKRQGWEFPAEDIAYFPGTHNAIATFVRRYTRENDGVMVLTPCYNYHEDVKGNGRRYVMIDMINDHEHYTIDYDALNAACAVENNSMLIMCHPHNPTGRVFSEEELQKVAEICRRHNVLIVSDEVHSDILREGQEFVPMMKACGPEKLIACTAINKTFNLAGLAVTNAVISDPELKNFFGGFYSEPSPFGIQAVISAYTRGEAWVDELNAYLDGNIDECIKYIHKHIPQAKVSRPEGGYSIYIDFTDCGFSDEELIDRIYRRAGVVLNSGAFFDDRRDKQVHRACLSSPRKICLDAFKKIAKELK